MTRTEQRKNKRRKNKFFFSPYLTEEQALAKWENGETVPDIERCKALADLYKVSLDELVNYSQKQSGFPIGPKGKHLFGIVKVGDKGQIVIPRKARKVFNIEPGDHVIVLGDEGQGIALIKEEGFLAMMGEIKKMAGQKEEEDEEDA